MNTEEMQLFMDYTSEQDRQELFKSYLTARNLKTLLELGVFSGDTELREALLRAMAEEGRNHE